MNDSNKNGINEALELIDQAFVQFVREIYGGRTPYAWQRRLVHELASTNRWPERLAAPTGAGKTMVIDVHVFLNALAGLASLAEILTLTESSISPPLLSSYAISYITHYYICQYKN